MHLPKVIHQSYKTWEQTSKKDKQFTEKLKAMNEDWQWVFWTDEDNRTLIETHYPWFLDIYDSYKYNIQRADAVRYFYMHKYGGVYLDLDMFPLRPLEELFERIKNREIQPLVYSNNPQVILFEEYPNHFLSGRAIYNAILASCQNCDFWEVVFKKLQDRYQSTPETEDAEKVVFETTGPKMLNQAFAEYFYSKMSAQNKAISSQVMLLPYFYSNPSWLPAADGGEHVPFFTMETVHQESKAEPPPAAFVGPPKDKNGKGFIDTKNAKDSYFMHDSSRTWLSDIRSSS